MLEDTKELEIKLLLDAICERYQYDFRGYSMASLRRRLALAKAHFGFSTYSQLQNRILHEPDSFLKLLTFLTVQVSELFRDPSYFRALREEVIPHLKTYPSLKVWVAGCAAGEELYSLAILFREEGLENRTIFYATDINPDALRRAQAGIYELERIPQFTENYQRAGGKQSLSEYYTAAYGSAIFDRTLRRQAVFSDHSLVSDHVFSEMHLVSCRNVLIYFDRPLQQRVLHLFRESLVNFGFLGLGAKETLRYSPLAEHFFEFSSAARIYRKKGVA